MPTHEYTLGWYTDRGLKEGNLQVWRQLSRDVPCADRLDMMLRATRSVASRTAGLRSLKHTNSIGSTCAVRHFVTCRLLAHNAAHQDITTEAYNAP